MAEETSPQKRYLVRAAEWKGDSGIRIAHTLNSNSELFWVALSDRVGMKRAHLAVGRIPPGRESFAYHAHAIQEEFVFILSGAGEAEIGEETHAVGPGDYMGFPTDGTAHHLRNTGDEDLVYLMGGERTEAEVSVFPKLGKRLVLTEGRIRVFEDADGHDYSIGEWIGNPNLDEESD